MFFVPGNRRRDAAIEWGARLEAEALTRARHVELAARLAVRLARVPYELPVKAAGTRDDLREISNRHLVAAAQVDRLAGVVALRRQHDAVGGVLDIEELTRRR